MQKSLLKDHGLLKKTVLGTLHMTGADGFLFMAIITGIFGDWRGRWYMNTYNTFVCWLVALEGVAT